ncbi:MAG: PilZ domain-containing protein [Candidatus Eremiobacterota bacterium]
MVFKHLVAGLRGLVAGRRGLPGVEDRRRLVRLRCDYTVLIKIADTVHSARITDISPQGLRLTVPEVTQTLKKDTQVLLSYRPGGVPVGRQRLRCRVIWSRRTRTRPQCELGLAFDDSPENLRFSWVQVVLQELGFDEKRLYRRKAMRVPVDLPVRLRNLDEGRDFSGEVLNLGVGGVLCRVQGDLNPGTTVRIGIGPYRKLPPLTVVGRVVSKRGDPEGRGILYGVRFLSYDSAEIRLLGEYVIHVIRENQD